MKFSCEKALLQAAISTTSRAVSPQKAPFPLWKGFCWRPAATSASPATTWRLASAPLSLPTSGRRALWFWAHACLVKIVRKLPDDIVTFQSENYMVNIKCGMSEFNILGTDPEEFPELPTVEYQIP